jgi:hypothetical protein
MDGSIVDNARETIEEVAGIGCSRKHLVDMLAVYLSMSTRADLKWSANFIAWALEAESNRPKSEFDNE